MAGDKGKGLYLLFIKSETQTPGGLVARPVLTSYYKSDHFPYKVYTSPNEAILCPDSFHSMYDRHRVGAVFASGLLQLNHPQHIRTGSLSTSITDPSIRSHMTRLMNPDPELADFIANWERIIVRIWPNTKSATLAPRDSYTTMPNMAYFEFLHHESATLAPRDSLVDLADVEIELVITTFCRYRVGDILRVTGFHNSAPQFQFVRRKNVLLSTAVVKGIIGPLQEKIDSFYSHRSERDHRVYDEVQGNLWSGNQNQSLVHPPRGKVNPKSASPNKAPPHVPEMTARMQIPRQAHSTASTPSQQSYQPVVRELPAPAAFPVQDQREIGRGVMKQPKPKAKDENKREMTMEEKQKLGIGLQNLPQEKIPQIIQSRSRRRSPYSLSLWMLVVFSLLVTANPITVTPNVVLAKEDGTGQFKTITAAIAVVPLKNNVPYRIYVKAGEYQEHVEIPSRAQMIELYGDGPFNTTISDNRSNATGTGTFYTATLTVEADNFFAHDIRIENTAGSKGGQAVALRVSGDQADNFFNVHIAGYQDTLYVHKRQQFYRDCVIFGIIDFVFGDALAIFQNCKFIVRKPLEKQTCMVTAQGREDPRGPGAIVIQKGSIKADPALLKAPKPVAAYLGRPWKPFSRTIIMDSNIDGFISPKGWAPWDGNIGLDTLYYAEFENCGPGSNQDRRVNWTGIRHIGPREAQNWTPSRAFEFDFDDWIRKKGIPYSP